MAQAHLPLKTLVIIPAHNEEEAILQTARSIREAVDADILVVNDGSEDATEHILRDSGIPHVTLPVNLGIGGAVQTGHIYALNHRYDVDIQVDGDGQHDPKYIPELVQGIVDGADLVIGSRFIEKEGFQTSFMRRVGKTWISWMFRVLTGMTITDPTSGFRASGKRAIELFSETYPADYPEPDSIMECFRQGFTVKEVPVKMRERQGGVSSITPLRSAYYMIKVTLALIITRIPSPGALKKGRVQ